MDATTLPPPGSLPGTLLGTPPDGLLATLHLGALHPAEQVLVYLLAFGPFAVLALVVGVRRHQDRHRDETTAPSSPGGPQRDR